MRSFAAAFFVWCALVATWFFFVYQFSAGELVVGALASTITLFAFHRSLLAEPLAAQLRISWLAAARHLPGATIEGLRMLLSLLSRHLQGQPSRAVWQGIPFRPTGDNEEKSGRCALTVLLLTLTPSSYVVDIDLEAHTMLTHALENTPVPRMVRELESFEGSAP